MKENAAVKGLIFRGARTWIINSRGEAGFEQFLAALPEGDRALWTESIILPVSWMPARLYRSMYDAEEALWGTGDGRIFRTAAASVAIDDLSTVMKLLMKLGSPGTVANRFPGVWDRYFDTGSLHIRSNERGKLEVALDEAAQVYGKAGCHGTIGWMGEALRYAGAGELRIDHRECAFAGAPRCVFRCNWR
jgi:hypothetical protein